MPKQTSFDKVARFTEKQSQAKFEMSMDEMMMCVREALSKKYPSDMTEDGPWVWMREVYMDSVVYEYDGMMMKAPYTIEDGMAVLGEPVEVEMEYVQKMSADAVERTCKLFEAGEYADKGMSVTVSDLDTLVAGFQPVPVKVQHVDTPFDNFIGGLKRIWRMGTELFGTIAFDPDAWALIDKSGAKKLSVGILKDKSALTEVSLVNEPRVASAAVFRESVVVFTTDACFTETNQKPDEAGNTKEEVVMAETKETYSKAEVDDLVASFAKDKSGLADEVVTLRKTMRDMKSETVVNDWLAKGKIVPAVLEFARELVSQTDEVITFGEGKESVSSLFSKFVEAMPQAVTFTEQGTEPKADEAKFSAEVLDKLGKMGYAEESAKKMLTAIGEGK